MTSSLPPQQPQDDNLWLEDIDGERQLDWARAHHPDGADFRLQDYRDTDGRYDSVVSVEMVEALGREYWPTFMDCLARNLKPGGRAAIQYIAMRDDLFDAYAASADFIQAYIFPGGLLIRTSEFRELATQERPRGSRFSCSRRTRPRAVPA